MNRAKRRDRDLMQGEDPATQDPRDARTWLTVYDEMIQFKRRLLDHLTSELARLPPLLHPDVAEDLSIINDQLKRYQERLDFWYKRHFALVGVQIDYETRVVTHNSASVKLTGREYQLLHVFLGHPDRYFTARQLVLEAWHDPALSGDQLRIYIASLRRKLKQLDLGRIINRPAHGYSLILD